MRRVLRVARILALAGLVVIVGFYGAFRVLLELSEREWLGRAPTHPAVDVRSLAPHPVALLDSGREALAARLRLIDAARSSIDLEIFIYELDTASRLLSQALARRAREGVRVRVLVDFAAPVFKLRPAYAAALAEAGVEVRYYNTAALTRFFAVQHRTHRKILAVDGAAAIVGGRNVADEYFDLAEHYNFLDSDLLLRGPAVASLVDSFELYWNSSWAAAPETEPGEGVDLLRPRPRETALAATLAQLPAAPEDSSCEDLQIVTDHPGSGVERRRVFAALADLGAEAESEVMLETPYFVLRSDGADVIADLLRRDVAVTVLTNSLRSTDAYYTVAPLLAKLEALNRPGLALWAYGGEAPAGSAAPSGSRWGVHAKRAVIDEDTVVIGTYNVDPRSANLNSEIVVICRGNRWLAAAVKASIRERMRHSVAVVGGASPQGRQALLAGADGLTLAKTALIMPLAWMFDFLL